MARRMEMNAGPEREIVMIHSRFILGRNGSRLSRPVRDFLTAFIAFGILAGPAVLCPESSCAVISSAAHAQIQAADQVNGVVSGMLAGPVAGGTHGLVTLITLSLAFASLVTLNLWIARHVRRVHATYRRQH